MPETNVSGSVSEQPEMTADEWLNECLRIGKEELTRALAMGMETSLDKSDLESALNEIVAQAPLSWVRTCIRNKVVDAIRDAQRLPEMEEMPDQIQVSSEEHLDIDMRKLNLVSLQALLTPEQFQAVALVHYSGYTHAAAGEFLGIEQQSLSERLHSAYIKIKKSLTGIPC